VDQVKTAALCLLLVSAILPVSAHADAKVGERLAQDVCTTCHIVSTDQAVRPVYDDALPNFEQIARRADFTLAWLDDFLKNKHASAANPTGMPNLRLTPAQTRDIYDYLASLRKP